MSTTVSLDTIHQRIVRELFGRNQPHITWPTATSTTASFVCGHAAYSSASANAYDGVYLYLPHSVDTTGGLVGAPKQTRVTRGGFTAATGAFAVSPAIAEGPTIAISAASLANPTVITTGTTNHNLATGDQVYVSVTDSTPAISGVYAVTVVSATTFSIEVNATGAGTTGVMGRPIYFTYGLSMDDIDEGINNIVRTLHLPRFIPVSLVTDGDMETSGVTNWTAVAAGTLSKVTAAANVILRQSLRVQGTSADDGVRSAVINVNEKDRLNVSVAIRCDTGTADVELYNADTSAVITGTTYTTNEEKFSEVRFEYSVDAGVERIQVQVTQNGATALDAYLGWVSVLTDRTAQYTIPSTITDASDILGVWFLPEGNYVDEDAQVLFQDFLVPVRRGEDIRDYFGATSHKIQIAPQIGPVFLECRQADTVLAQNAGDTDTTIIPVQIIVNGAVSECHRRLGHEREAQLYHKKYVDALEAINLGKPTISWEPVTRVRAI